jgi:16S rRNA (cytidine1402-2'-O)-methyltransferase
VVVARELTKIYEELVRGKVSAILKKFEQKTIKGEVVILIKGTE